MNKVFSRFAGFLVALTVFCSCLPMADVAADGQTFYITIGAGKSEMTAMGDGTFTYKVGKTQAGSAGTITVSAPKATKAGTVIEGWLMTDCMKYCERHNCECRRGGLSTIRPDMEDCAVTAFGVSKTVKVTFTNIVYKDAYSMLVYNSGTQTLVLKSYSDSNYSVAYAGGTTGAVVKKGSTIKDKNYKYKVTKLGSTSGAVGTVTVTGANRPGYKTIKIAATVKIGGVKYKVTSIANGAFKKMPLATKVYIGKNVKTIGSKAFYNSKKIKKVVINSKKVKKIGKRAFKGIKKKAVIKVPKSKKKAYKKLVKRSKSGKVVVK